MTRSAVTSGKAKQATFKQAFDAISRYRDEGNFLAAYVVTFSIIEDRVKALYVNWHLVAKGIAPTQKDINGSFLNHVKSLGTKQLIPADLVARLTAEAKQRNEFMHSAMWNLDAFTESIVNKAMQSARDVNNAERRAKTKLKEFSSQNHG